MLVLKIVDGKSIYENVKDIISEPTAEEQIAELKQKLASYDYIGVKIATGRATREEYIEKITQMTEWADKINELEAKLNG